MYRHFVIISPWKRVGRLFEQSSPKDMHCANFGWISPVALEKKMKKWKYYDHDNDNDDGQRTYLIQKSSLEPSAQVS